MSSFKERLIARLLPDHIAARQRKTTTYELPDVNPRGPRKIVLPHSAPLELFHNVFSLCSAKVRLCLAETGIAYRSIHVNLIETGEYETLSPWFLSMNPAATVPVLLHKGRPIYDSAEQIQYIDKYLTGPSNSLIPPGHADEVREWVNFTSVDCVHDFNELDTHQRMGCCVPGCTLPMFAALLRETRLSNIAWGIGKHPVKIRPPIMCLLKLIGPYLIIILPKMRRVVQDARDAMRVQLQGIDELLSDGRPYLVGDTFTLADVSLMVVFERLDVGGFADTLYSDLNHVVRYWDRMKQRPSYGTAIKEQELPRVVRATAQVEKWKRDRPWWAAYLFTPKEGGGERSPLLAGRCCPPNGQRTASPLGRGNRSPRRRA